ncbi:19617_t:CDS:1, partial [Gigaspora rosea]
QKQYKPKEDIKEEWYDQVLSEITLKESLSTSHNNSASGISGITYPVLRRLGKYTTIFCIKLLSKCLASGKIPQKWKVGLLYPIPKKENWNFNLNNVRLIILLETIRKVLNK